MYEINFYIIAFLRGKVTKNFSLKRHKRLFCKLTSRKVKRYADNNNGTLKIRR
jgi:hypothetical protein